MNKKSRTLVILLAVLVVFAALYALLRYISTQKEQEEEASIQAGITYVSQLEDATSLSYHSEDEDLSFTLNNGVWSYDADPDFPLDQSKVGLIASALKNLTATRTLENGEDSSAYGFDAPSFTLGAKNAAGDTLTLVVGSMASNGDYYVMREGEEGIYTISSSLPQQFTGLYSFYSLPVIPYSGCTADTVNATGSLAGGSGISLSGLAESDSDEASAFKSAWTSLAFDSCFAYHPDEATLSQCGLATPALSVEVSYAEGAASTLLIGAQNDAGDYYARLGTDGDICILPQLQVTSLLSALGIS